MFRRHQHALRAGFARAKQQGHAKEMAYLIERPKRQAARLHAILAKKPPREVPPSPPPPKRGIWSRFFGKELPKISLYGPDTFGLMHQKRQEHKPFESGHGFCRRLEKKGWKLLGSGYHSRVLAKGDSNRVIKVGCSADNWMRYVLWGRKHGYEGNFVPKVYSYKYFKAKVPFYVAIVEKMERTTSEGCREDKDHVLLDLFGMAKRNDHAKAALNMLEQGCGDFARNLCKAANDNNWSMDLHGGNFMTRKDGSWVATDPIDAHGDTPTERIRSRAA